MTRMTRIILQCVRSDFQFTILRPVSQPPQKALADKMKILWFCIPFLYEMKLLHNTYFQKTKKKLSEFHTKGNNTLHLLDRRN